MPLITNSMVYRLSKQVNNNRRNKDILQIGIWVFFCQYHRLILVPYYPWVVRNIGNVMKGIDNILQNWKRTFEKGICFMWAQNVNFTPLHSSLKKSIKILHLCYMHETSRTCRSKPSLSVTFIKLLTYLKFEPVNMFMHNCNIFYIIIYANLCKLLREPNLWWHWNWYCWSSPLLNDAISVSIRCKVWKICAFKTTPLKIATFRPDDNELIEKTN
jgi:hypothetical protein